MSAVACRRATKKSERLKQYKLASPKQWEKPDHLKFLGDFLTKHHQTSFLLGTFWFLDDPGGSKGALHRIVSPGRLLQQAVQRWQSHWALSKFSKFWPSRFSNCTWSSSSSSSSSPTKIDHDRSTYLIILHYVQKAMTFAFFWLAMAGPFHRGHEKSSSSWGISSLWATCELHPEGLRERGSVALAPLICGKSARDRLETLEDP